MKSYFVVKDRYGCFTIETVNLEDIFPHGELTENKIAGDPFSRVVGEYETAVAAEKAIFQFQMEGLLRDEGEINTKELARWHDSECQQIVTAFVNQCGHGWWARTKIGFRNFRRGCENQISRGQDPRQVFVTYAEKWENTHRLIAAALRQLCHWQLTPCQWRKFLQSAEGAIALAERALLSHD